MRALAVPVAEPGSGIDYADAFEVEVRVPDERSAEAWVRCGLEGAPAVVRRIIQIAHRRVLRFRLAPPSSPDHVLGWAITESAPDVIRLEATSPILRAAIVGRRSDPTHTRLTTLLWFGRRTLARAIWVFVGPLHRRIAPYLLARAADGR